MTNEAIQAYLNRKLEAALDEVHMEEYEAAHPTPAHIPYGRCPRHPHVVISNGMFDGMCNLCEQVAENEN
ncbi:Uncharacterised protein [uncultured archaeon]|nr:Uncharacterised protein [uncultured archaeon]